MEQEKPAEIENEVATPQAEVAQNNEVVEAKEETAPPAQPTKSDNWEQARRVLALQKSKIDELEARLHELTSKQAPVEEELDEIDKLDPDEVMTVAQARKLVEKKAEKQAKKAAQEIVNEYSQKKAVEEDEIKMRSSTADYDYVIENYAIPLMKSNPALAQQVRMSKNPAQTAYKLGKLSDSYKDMEPQAISPKAEKIIKNAQKPVSPHAVQGGSLKDQANAFEKLSKQDIWRMSQKFANSA